MNKLLFAVSILLFSCFGAHAQNLQSFIPTDAAAVIHLKPAIIQSKVNFAELKALPLVSSMFSGLGFSEDMSLADMGISDQAESYLFFKIGDYGPDWGMFFEISDEEMLKAFTDEMGEEPLTYFSMGDFEVADMGEGYLGIHNNIGFFGGSSAAVDFDQYEDLDWEEIEKKESDMQLAATSQMLVGGFDNSNAKWRKQLMAGKGVVSVYVDYGASMSRIMDFASMGYRDPSMDMMESIYGSLYQGMELFMDMQFNNGVAQIDMNYTYPERLLKNSNITKSKINRKFRKYLRGDNLVGYISSGVQTKEYGQLFKNMVFQIADNQPELMGLGRDAAGLLGMLIDEEAIYNFIKGDMVVAFTGMRTFEKEITTYEYDEDFNPIEKTEMTSSQLPEFTAMVSYGDAQNMKRIFNIGEKLGVLAPSDNYYSVSLPDIPFDLFLSMHDGILFISNDTDLMTRNLSSGLRAAKVSKQDWKKMKKSAMAINWNIPKTMAMLSANGMPIDDSMVNMSKEALRNIEFVVPKNQNGTYKSSFKFNFVNQKENSLKLLLGYINDMAGSSPSQGTSM